MRLPIIRLTLLIVSLSACASPPLTKPTRPWTGPVITGGTLLEVSCRAPGFVKVCEGDRLYRRCRCAPRAELAWLLGNRVF